MIAWQDALFTPRRVAVVGASATPGKAGALFLRNLAAVESGYGGEVVGIHPSAREVLGFSTGSGSQRDGWWTAGECVSAADGVLFFSRGNAVASSQKIIINKDFDTVEAVIGCPLDLRQGGPERKFL